MSMTEKILLLTLFQGLMCQRWDIPTLIEGLIGSCVEIPCMFYPRRNSGTFTTVWYISINGRFHQIFNSDGNSLVLNDYKDRTSVLRGNNRCSLRIDPVRREDGEEYYYPRILEHQRDHINTQNRINLHVTDTPDIPELRVSDIMIEGRPETLTCSVIHTCGSTPPSLTWNKLGQTERQSEDLSGGIWREISRLTYIPSYKDDQTEIRCTATHHNGRTSTWGGPLDIIYAPKEVTVSVPKNRAILQGSDVTLTCSSRSNPPPFRYEWYHGGNNKTKLTLEGQQINVRNIRRDTEPYTCVVTNYYGRGESPPTEIPVQYAAVGIQVIELRPTEGATELKCSFVSSNPNVTHYTWMKDGNRLINMTGPILVLDGKGDTSGSYSCIAHNTVGSSTSVEQLLAESQQNSKDGPNLLLILGTLGGVILLILFVFVYIRIKKWPTSSRQENGQPDAIYTDLVISEVSSDYSSLKPGGRAATSDGHYENFPRKE